MRTTADRPADERGVTFPVQLARLLDEVEELNRQLERIEAETQEALRRTAREGFEEYR